MGKTKAADNVIPISTCPKCHSSMTGRLNSGQSYCRGCGYSPPTGDGDCGSKPEQPGVSLLGSRRGGTNAQQYSSHLQELHGSELVPINYDTRMATYDTDLAWCVRIAGHTYWFPKSNCKFDTGTGGTDNVVMVPEWLAVEKGLV